ncbi:sulfotransferase [Primorskyibacter sp. 2E107]|uniref:tetratricopeptide repeat-containing sulfotransferase family protein n=1 Tax=Primorskyibacter sp. 2E107 TaxID=3403458 RepID=UPI003AF677EF
MSRSPMSSAATSMDPVIQALQMAEAGNQSDAAALLRRVLAKDSRNVDARRALAGMGAHARPALRLFGVDRTAADAIRAAMMANDWQTIIAQAPALLERQPLAADAANALGTALRMTGQNNKALRVYEHALRVDPALPDTYINLSSMLQQAGQAQAAAEAARGALDVAPAMAESHLAMGLALYDLDDVADAETHLRRATELAPKKFLTWDALCRALERLNKLDDLARTLNAALHHCPGQPLLLLHKAAMLNRQKDDEAALDVLNRIDPGALPPHSRSVHSELRGRALDALDRPAEAFDAFARMNAIQRDLHVPPNHENIFTRMITGRLDGAARIGEGWSVTDTDGPQPVFMVGFPRSGTTLLDTILRGHDGVAVVEEMPMVAQLNRGIPSLGENAALAALPAEAIAERRAAYLASFEQTLGAALNGRLPVDKLPLNLAEAGSIARHFPKARFILSLRHPADCVLSCFMQNFKPNEAMNTFLDIEQAARTYDTLFSLWETYRARLGLDVVEIRYEDLIGDLQGAVEPVLNHIGLDWHDGMADYRKSAAARPVIRTPSYKQVTQDLYDSADGRWRRYEDMLAPAMPILQPWIDRWGYAL